jgi:phosphatidylglycerophosphate synthase
VEVAPQTMLCERVSDEASARRAEARLLEGARKDSDTLLAKYFDRHVSGWITRRVLPTALTPNQLTVLNTALALVGVVLLGVGTHPAQVAGAAILVFSIVLDGCDGEVARVKFMQSELGRRLDFFSDNVVNAGAIAAIGIGAFRRFGDPTYLALSLLSGAAAAACAWPVYVVFFRDRAPAQDVAPTALHRVLGALNGRDFFYLVLVLAVADKTHWFVYPCFAGLAIFLPLTLALYVRHAMRPGSRSGAAGRPE